MLGRTSLLGNLAFFNKLCKTWSRTTLQDRCLSTDTRNQQKSKLHIGHSFANRFAGKAVLPLRTSRHVERVLSVPGVGWCVEASGSRENITHANLTAATPTLLLWRG